MKFNKIACVDYTKMNKEAITELQEYSEEEIIHPDDFPETDEEILERIGDAEVIFVSWKTQITKEIIQKCPNLKYIGMCCSLFDDASANVAVDYARENGITVTGIFDYGDPGVAEFVISELIMLIHGYAEKQWKDIPQELTDLKIGIIGGSGMEDPKFLSSNISKNIDTPFGDTSSELISGSISNIPTVVISRHGLNHSINPTNVNYRANIWALKEEGCSHIFAITACGSLREKIAPGHFIFPNQFIDRTTKRISTFFDGSKVQHISMGNPFSKHLRKCLVKACKSLSFHY